MDNLADADALGDGEEEGGEGVEGEDGEKPEVIFNFIIIYVRGLTI